MQKVTDQIGFFIGGCDSRNDPAYLAQNKFAWGFNGLNRGGMFRTRPGLIEMGTPVTGELSDINHPQGFTIFTPLNQLPHAVVAHGGRVYVSPYPFNEWTMLSNLEFFPYREIVFEKGIRSLQTNADGSLTVVKQPYPILLIQDGISYSGYWDGNTSGHDKKVAIASAMRWVGDRMWFGLDRKVRAGDLADPLGMNEELITASGGFFTLDGDCTGLGKTPDLKAVLAFTNENTTAFQAFIRDRKTWRDTPEFAKTLFEEIGCVSHKSIINKYGLTWWDTHEGLIALDAALQTYRTSSIHYKDHAMHRSKINLSSDRSRTCVGFAENLLLLSCPSGDKYNAHTWVADQVTLELTENQSAMSWAGVWTGIRPVEWCSAVINGRKRLFVLSRDFGSDPTKYRVTLWEAMSGQRADVLNDGTVKRITCGFEGRMQAFSPQPKRITTIELVPAMIVGTVDIRIYWAGLRSGYVLAGTKRVISTEGSIGGPLQIQLDTETILQPYLPQTRTIRTQEIEVASTKGVQSPNINSLDLGFSVYVEWEGEMAIRYIRMFTVPEPDQQYGVPERDETTAHIFQADGVEIETDNPPSQATAYPNSQPFADSLSSKLTEPEYSSR